LVKTFDKQSEATASSLTEHRVLSKAQVAKYSYLNRQEARLAFDDQPIVLPGSTTNSAQRQSAETMVEVAFAPGAVCGSSLTQAQVQDRQHACTRCAEDE